MAFSLSPSRVTAAVLDYSQPAAAKLFSKATSPMDPKYDGKPAGLRTFLQQVSTHAELYAWNGLCLIEKADGSYVDLLTRHGELSLEEIRADAEVKYVGQDIRYAQDSYMMYMYLINSIDPDTVLRVTANPEHYVIPYVVGVDEMEHPDGPALLKYIIMKVHLDTRATVEGIRASISRLRYSIVEHNSDIKAFNQYVENLRVGLTARGATTTDLLSNLFQAYDQVEDAKFRSWATNKKNDYYEGKDLTPESFMALADQFYAQALEERTWAKPTAEAEQIVALQAELKTQQLKLQIADKKSTRRGGRFAPRAGAAQANSSRARGPANPGTAGARKSGTQDWMGKPPKDGEPLVMTKGTKEWVWCPTHKRWGTHEEKDCRLKRNMDADGEDGAPTRRAAFASFWEQAREDADEESDEESEQE